MIELAIVPLLTSMSAITAQLGTRPSQDTGIYPLTVPTNPTLPAIAYQVIASVESPAVNAPLGVVRSRLQIDCVASTYGEAVTLRDAVRQSLAGFMGVVNGVTIQNTLPLTTRDLYEEVLLQYVARIELYLWWS